MFIMTVYFLQRKRFSLKKNSNKLILLFIIIAIYYSLYNKYQDKLQYLTIITEKQFFSDNLTKNSNTLKLYTLTTKNLSSAKLLPVANKTKTENFIYILQWIRCVKPKELEKMLDFNCEYTNCKITENRTLFGDITKFDAIVFSTPYLTRLGGSDLPEARSPHQKYIFHSLESPVYYPVCSHIFDSFFNWTFTYRLDSDIQLKYVEIQDSQGVVIGPKPEMHWIKLDDMDPVPEDLRRKLKSKSKLATWIVTNCQSKNKREVFVRKLNKVLAKRGYEVDIFGECGSANCYSSCMEMLEKDYFFYLSFENSFGEDYVTEKLIDALNYYTIPIVYGGANYTRFLPDGIYLNARELGIQKLATKMIEIRNNFDKFVEFFKWRNHYRYNDNNLGKGICDMCILLNNKDQMKKTTVHENFRKWWNPPDFC